MDYGFAIIKVISLLFAKLEDVQNTCLHRLFGGSWRFCVKMNVEKTINNEQSVLIYYEAQLISCSLLLSVDSILTCLLPHICLSTSHSEIQPFCYYLKPTYRLASWLIIRYGQTAFFYKTTCYLLPWYTLPSTNTGAYN